MRESKYSKLDYWQEQKDDEFPEISNAGTDYSVDTISKGTLFLWTSMTAPAPSFNMTGMWELVPNVKALAGYIRYNYLVNFFAIWLKCDDELDLSNEVFDAEEIFLIAEAMEGLKYKEDIPLMKQILAEIDSVFELPSNQGFEILKSAIQKFNDRWNDTRTWCFEISIYKSTVEVGEVIFNNQEDVIQEIYLEQLEEQEDEDEDEDEDDEEDEGTDQDEATELTKVEWLKICKGVYTDADDFSLFLSVLDGSNCLG